jgi:hypothetical protein
MRWATVALCTLALSALFLLDALPARADVSSSAPGPALVLVSQTQWVTPAAPWYSLKLAVRSGAGPAGDLHVSVTVYSRIDDSSDLQQAMDTTPDQSVRTRVSAIPVTAGANGLVASACITVLPDDSTVPPTPAPGTSGACPSAGPTVTLDCTRGDGTCDDIYPVSVALLRTGDSAPLARFTTFLTYEEPGVAVAPDTGGPLRVGWIVPVQNSIDGHSAAANAARGGTEELISLLAAHHDVPATFNVSPTTVTDLATNGGTRSLQQLAALTAASGPDQLLTPTYVPVDLAALAGAGLSSEIPLQLARGSQLLHQAALDPSPGSWVEPNADLSDADVDNLTTGLAAVGATHLVLSDAALASIANPTGFTFAQPFTLPLAHGTTVVAVASDGLVDSRFTADAADPALAANQLLAALSFIHFENEFRHDPRGVALVPPAAWQPSPAFVSTLLSGLANSQIVSPVTLDQLFSQVPQGGNDEPTVRHLQAGPGVGQGGLTATAAARIVTARSQFNSYTTAAVGHPAVLTTLSDTLLATESENLNAAARAVALSAYTHRFDKVLSTVSLAVERTITFTARNAPVPITVLSSAPYKVTVVLNLSSDKFTFPNGADRTMVLNHPTTSVRIEARARTSGDRLPIDVTLLTPDGRLAISHTVLTVHSTEISIVGIALTVLAALVLLVWWIRTWHGGRRRRPRAH